MQVQGLEQKFKIKKNIYFGIVFTESKTKDYASFKYKKNNVKELIQGREN